LLADDAVSCEPVSATNSLQTGKLNFAESGRPPVAGGAAPTGSAGHAGTTASLKLTFHLDHSVGANQFDPDSASIFSRPLTTQILFYKELDKSLDIPVFARAR
jgi:hypothetical protein